MSYTFSDSKKILFLDIETVSGTEQYEQLEPRLQALWEKKCKSINKEEEPVADFYGSRAAIYAEFGKVVSIAVGFVYTDADGEPAMKVRSFSGHDELELLREFGNFLSERGSRREVLLCAHNGKEFDFPYLARRMLIHGLPIPEVLQTSGKKPWEVKHLDTMHLWKFGDWKSYTSLDLLAALFQIPTSKSDIDGSMVNHVYYIEKDLPRIDEYCRQDVAVTIQLFLRLNSLPLIQEDRIALLK